MELTNQKSNKNHLRVTQSEFIIEFVKELLRFICSARILFKVFDQSDSRPMRALPFYAIHYENLPESGQKLNRFHRSKSFQKHPKSTQLDIHRPHWSIQHLHRMYKYHNDPLVRALKVAKKIGQYGDRTRDIRVISTTL